MIRVEVNRKGQTLLSISLTGHAMYDDFGKDIVCSAVSTCLITTVNGIADINPHYLEVKQDKNGVLLTIREENQICSKLLFNMLHILEDLKEQYPKNITMINKEGNV